MNAIPLLILEKDMEYGHALSMAVSNLHNEFHVSLCRLEEYKNFNLEKFQLLLVGEYDEPEQKELSLKSKRIIWLTEEEFYDDRTNVTKYENPKFQIYKYSKVSEIVANLRFFYGLLSGRQEILKDSLQTNVIGFCGASGGVGKTVISISAAREMSRYHDKKVLYINFEEISATAVFMPGGQNQRGISDFLYYLFEKKSASVCSYLDSFTYSDLYGVNTFFPNDGRNELRQLEKDELIYFMKTLSDSHRYDYIVLDLPCDLCEETICLLEHCKKVVYIGMDDIVHNYKKKVFMDCIGRWGVSQPAGRLIEVINQSSFPQSQKTEDRSDFSSSLPEKPIQIERDTGSFSVMSNGLAVSIDHVFGLGIKRLVTVIMDIQ